MNRTTSKEITVSYADVDFVLTYSAYGKYIPATYWEPADYPEIDLEKVCVEGSSQDIMELLDQMVVEKLYEILIDKINEEEDDY